MYSLLLRILAYYNIRPSPKVGYVCRAQSDRWSLTWNGMHKEPLLPQVLQHVLPKLIPLMGTGRILSRLTRARLSAITLLTLTSEQSSIHHRLSSLNTYLTQNSPPTWFMHILPVLVYSVSGIWYATTAPPQTGKRIRQTCWNTMAATARTISTSTSGWWKTLRRRGRCT